MPLACLTNEQTVLILSANQNNAIVLNECFWNETEYFASRISHKISYIQLT